jgi:hypothetical protein
MQSSSSCAPCSRLQELLATLLQQRQVLMAAQLKVHHGQTLVGQRRALLLLKLGRQGQLLLRPRQALLAALLPQQQQQLILRLGLQLVK